ncbi:hypothetical protein PIB30_058409 [Stylosanthes scabra]|uniref:CCHC-type domain-containing protein n=1 Tax=Stylosanthes scabra TaxID=79078 RepID=A0ABU6SKY4_9FABA|nr:hypothetical protein [Stylosanthes scabra]
MAGRLTHNWLLGQCGCNACSRWNSLLVKNLWPEWMGSSLRPNLHMKRKNKGGPVSARIRNEMNMFEYPEKRCEICRRYGHIRRGCPNAHAGSD